VSSTVLLRIASVMTMIHCTLHTVGGVFGKPRPGSPEAGVLEVMQGTHFNVMGSSRTYFDFVLGYGLFTTIALFVQAILFWQLSVMVKTAPGVARPIVILFTFNCALSAIVSWKYFFAGPGIFQSLIAACLAAAYFTAASLVSA
jgi:hypothetical protein